MTATLAADTSTQVDWTDIDAVRTDDGWQATHTDVTGTAWNITARRSPDREAPDWRVFVARRLPGNEQWEDHAHHAAVLESEAFVIARFYTELVTP